MWKGSYSITFLVVLTLGFLEIKDMEKGLYECFNKVLLMILKYCWKLIEKMRWGSKSKQIVLVFGQMTRLWKLEFPRQRGRETRTESSTFQIVCGPKVKGCLLGVLWLWLLMGKWDYWWWRSIAKVWFSCTRWIINYYSKYNFIIQAYSDHVPTDTYE